MSVKLVSTPNTFPGFRRIFYMSDPITARPYRGKPDIALTEQYQLTRAEILPSRPVVITYDSGKTHPGDIIWTTTAVMVIVHQRIIDILQDNRFTGWSTYPVEVYDRDGDLVPDYYGLSITGRCGFIGPNMSKIQLEEYPGGWFPCFKGVFFNPRTWDSSHFFKEVIEPGKDTGLAGIFITSEVRSAFLKAKVANVDMERLSDITVSAPIYEVISNPDLPENYRERLAAAYRKVDVPVPKRYADLPL